MKLFKPAKRFYFRQFSMRDWVMIIVGIIITLSVVGVITLINNAQVPLKADEKGITISWLPPTVLRWGRPINEMSEKYDVDPNMVAIIMTLESGGYSKADSEAGARGLMQVMPAAKHLKDPRKKYDLADPRTNIEFGTAYLAHLRDVFGEVNQGPSWNYTVELIAAGYNGGPGAANSIYKGDGLQATETVVYSRDAFNMWRERHAAKSPTFDRWKERGGTVLLDKAKAER
jgi:soluble lytic murein transglycosylase-like protein